MSLLKLAGSSWGANAHTLRITGLALVYSTAEYCCPVWMNSTHVDKIDWQLNTTLRIISGTIKSTPLSWLPVLANIAPHAIRRKHAIKREWDNYQTLPDTFPVNEDLRNIPLDRLKSRKPFWKEEFLHLPFSVWDTWKVYNQNLILDPTKVVPGFDQSRKIWTKLNRIRTGHGRCNNMLYSWNAVDSPACEYREERETIKNIVEECPITKLQQGFPALHQATPEIIQWLLEIKNL